jgi:hypothetical protein
MAKGYGNFVRQEQKLQTKPVTNKALNNMRDQFKSKLAQKVVTDTQGGLSMDVKGYGH